MLKQIAIFK